MRNSKLALAIVATVLVLTLAVGVGFYLYRGRSSDANAAGITHTHPDGTVETHAVGELDDHAEADGQIPVIGNIDRVDGNTIIVKDIATSVLKSFERTPDAKIHRQEAAQISDIQPGTTITALGPEKDGIIQADIVLIGKDAAMGARLPLDVRMMGGPLSGEGPGPGIVMPLPSGEVPPAGGPGGPGGPSGPPAGGPGGPSGPPAGGPGVQPAFQGPGVETSILPDPVTGTVEQVEGNTIMVKNAAGATVKVQIAPKAQVQKHVEAQPSEITPGQLIMALPPLNGEPMRLRILLTQTPS